MKNFVLGFLTCMCVGFILVQSYLIWCPVSKKNRDIHITNQMILPYNGFALRPLNNGPVFPHNNFPLFNLRQDQDESINKN